MSSVSNKSSNFRAAFEKALDDGKVTGAEAKDIQAAVKKDIKASGADRGAAAMEIAGTLSQVDSTLQTNAMLGMGINRSEVFEASADSVLKKTRAMLGAVIGASLPAGGPAWTPEAKEKFTRDFAEMAGGVELYGPAAVFPFVDKQLGALDSAGLSGPAKMKLDTQREAFTTTLLAETATLAKDVDERFAGVMLAETFRAATGKYLSPELETQLKTELAGASKEDIQNGLKHLQDEVKRLTEGGANTFALRNYLNAMKEGVAYFQGLVAANP